MSSAELMTKALRAIASARLLLNAGDTDGACNRAYYAMFDAARAALFASSAPVEAEVARTHNGLITAFSLHLVKTGKVPVDLGRALNRAEEIRLIADYQGTQVTRPHAEALVQQADTFIQAMRNAFLPTFRETD